MRLIWCLQGLIDIKVPPKPPCFREEESVVANPKVTNGSWKVVNLGPRVLCVMSG